MHGQRNNLRILLCAIVMLSAALSALAWWGMSLISMALLAFGLVCLAAGCYSWMTGRRISRLLDRRHPAVAGADERKL